MTQTWERRVQRRYVPAFMREEAAEVEGAKRGTVYHRILECLDYTCADTLNQVQARYYKEALERVTGKKVKETYIYSLQMGRAVEVVM